MTFKCILKFLFGYGVPMPTATEEQIRNGHTMWAWSLRDQRWVSSNMPLGGTL